jgi:hypothetical protein
MSKNLFFSENLEKLTLNEPQKESKITQSIEVTAANKPAKEVKNIIEKEKTENKKLNMVIYDYIKSCNVYLTSFYLLLCILSNIAQVLSNCILSYWTNKTEQEYKSKVFYFGFFFLIGFISCN